MARANCSISLRPRARMTPLWRSTSSYTLSSPASAPVCELAACAPSAVRPALSTMTGFFFETRFATSANERPSLRSSMCIAIALVASSCSKNVSRSSSSMSALLPRPTIAETPIFAERLKPMIAMPDAAALRRERDAALDVVRRAERRAQVLGRVVEAVDVRPHQAHVVLAPDRLDLELALFVARLGEAGRDQHRARNLLLAALGRAPRRRTSPGSRTPRRRRRPGCP